jgi:CARDB protein
MPFSTRRVTTVSAVLCAALLTACADAPLTGPTAQARVSEQRSEDVRAAIAAQNRNMLRLHAIPGVVGTAVGLNASGDAAIQVLVVDNTPRTIPDRIDGIPVEVKVTGMLVALSDPTLRLRPAPVGYSVGHPAITAGTIGARVTDGTNVFILSNNHVLANMNDASIGDASLQPGAFDGGTSADQIGTLAAFAPISFSGGNNWIDAAIALSSTADLGNATPLDDGYGTPNSQIYNDANSDRNFDNLSALLNTSVKKYGRTTKLTVGAITGINATVDICYEVLIIFCVKSAHFVDQLIITPGGFSGGGDSGSLIVTNTTDANPVALLFAGSSAQTIANRIDHVLNWFNVNVDGSATEPPPPPDPITDVAVVGVNVPANVTSGATVNVGVTVRNAGNQNVGAFDVSLSDETDAVAIGTQSVAGLAPGASVTRTFAWNTGATTLGVHLLRGVQTLVDDNAANDAATATTSVNAVPTNTIHIGDLDGSTSGTNRWNATVEITVHDVNHQPINGARILGTWTPLGLNSNDCTSGELGGIGTCIMLYPSIARSRQFVTLTVNSVSMAERSYQASANHDPDGSSNGSSIRVNRP